MKHFLIHTVLAALLLTSAPAALPQVPVPARFDMGTTNSALAVDPLTPGSFTRVSADDTYPTGAGYGWVASSSTVAQDRTAVPDQVVHNLPPELLVDFVERADSIRFRVDLPASATYHCMLYLGDVDNARSGMTVTTTTDLANGPIVIEVATEVHARTISKKASYDQAYGGFRRVSFLADVAADGVLEIEVANPGELVPVQGLEIYAYTEPPIRYSHLTKGIVATVSVEPRIAAGIAAYNQLDPDYDAALMSFDSSPDKLQSAWGKAFVVGALKGTMEQVDIGPLDGSSDTGVLGGILADLSGLMPTFADDSAVRSLYVEARDLEAGVLFERTRGYSSAVFPNPGNLDQSPIVTSGGADPIVLHLSAAVQLFEQIDDDVFDPIASSTATESPFFPVSQYLIGRNLFGRNSQVGTEGEQADLEQALYLMEILTKRIWPAVEPSGPDQIFREAHEAVALCWPLVEWGEDIDNLPDPAPEKLFPGGVYSLWKANLFALPPLDPTETWWGPLVDPPAVTGGYPDWAEAQRKVAFQVRNAARWWAKERLYGAELGGGAGDDVEFPLLVSMIGRRESADHPEVEAPLSRVYDRALYAEPTMSKAEGYVKKAGDVEHTAEPSSFSLGILVPMHYGEPRYLTFLMRTVRNMEDAHQSGSPNKWTAMPMGSNFRHFLSWSIGGKEPPGSGTNEDQDVPLNMKALLPAQSLVDYGGAPKAAELLEEYAWAWRNAAMRTDNNKPLGFFPGSVTVAADGTPGAIGQDGLWYRSGLNTQTIYKFDYPGGSTIGMMGQLYQLLGEVARTSTDPNATDLLDPLVAVLGFVPDENAAIGTGAKAAFDLATEIANAAVLSREALEAKGVLSTTLDQWIGDYATLVLDDPQIEDFEEADAFDRYFWPHATTLVNYVDRIRFGYVGRNLLYTQATGAPLNLTPTYVLTWENMDADAYSTQADELDVAIRIVALTPSEGTMDGALDVLLYNFGAADAHLDARVWRALEFGEYDVETGDSDGMGGFAGTPLLSSFDFTKKGDKVCVTVPPGSLRLLRLTQQTSHGPTPADHDLALSSQAGTFGVGGNLNVSVSNLGPGSYSKFDGFDVQVSVDGWILATKSVSKDIPAPALSDSGLDPQSVRVIIEADYSGIDENSIVTIELLNVVGEQITTENDVVHRRFGDIP